MQIDLNQDWQLAVTPLFIFLSLWSLRLYSRKKKPQIAFSLYLIAATGLLIATQYLNVDHNHAYIPETKLSSRSVDSNPILESSFSPNQGATELILRTIRSARESIWVAAYSFTSKPIAEALARAHSQGIDVRVVLDKSQRKEQHSAFYYFRTQQIPTRINSNYAIMHNKFMIIDGVTLQTGSFNYSKAAEFKNAENVLVVHKDPRIIQQYSQQWLKLWDEAE